MQGNVRRHTHMNCNLDMLTFKLSSLITNLNMLRNHELQLAHVNIQVVILITNLHMSTRVNNQVVILNRKLAHVKNQPVIL